MNQMEQRLGGQKVWHGVRKQCIYTVYCMVGEGDPDSGHHFNHWGERDKG